MILKQLPWRHGPVRPHERPRANPPRPRGGWREPRRGFLLGCDSPGKVWLALDGETLFVDRNGNGDLTEAGERFEPQDRRGLPNSQGGYRDWQYEIGDLEPAGDTTKHTRFKVVAYQLGDATVCHVLSLWVNAGDRSQRLNTVAQPLHPGPIAMVTSPRYFLSPR